jgi:proline iminopeptidase
LLALLYAIQNPERIERMLLVTPASITTKGRRGYLDELSRRTADLGILNQQRELLRSDLRRRDPDAFRQRAFELTLAPYLKDPKKPTGIAPFRISHRVREAVWRSLGDYDLTNEISSLSVPTLVIHGRYDPIPLSSSQQTATLLGAQLEVFEDSGHIPFFEERERFLTIASEFLPRDHEPGSDNTDPTAED